MTEKKEEKKEKIKMNIFEKLNMIQIELKSPKNVKNAMYNFNYRNLDSIFENLKPLLKKYKVVIKLEDEIVLIGERYYIKATASLIDYDGEKIEATAFARESFEQKRMQAAQLTGSTSSYARKYALGGLLAIDDSRDADSFEEIEEEKKPQQNNTSEMKKVSEERKRFSELINKTVFKFKDKKQAFEFLKSNNIEPKKLLVSKNYLELKSANDFLENKIKGGKNNVH